MESNGRAGIIVGQGRVCHACWEAESWGNRFFLKSNSTCLKGDRRGWGAWECCCSCCLIWFIMLDGGVAG